MVLSIVFYKCSETALLLLDYKHRIILTNRKAGAARRAGRTHPRFPDVTSGLPWEFILLVLFCITSYFTYLNFLYVLFSFGLQHRVCRSSLFQVFTFRPCFKILKYFNNPTDDASVFDYRSLFHDS